MKIAAQQVDLAYGQRLVLEALSLEFQTGEMVAIIGPNGCGKSTLLRALARLLRPRRGVVLLDNRDIHRMSTRALARLLAVLPQSPEGVPDLTVEELVWRGRYPYQGWIRGASQHDRQAVRRALAQCSLEDLADRRLGSLSGGERQRAWIALALAQEPQVLLLDEPTSFLDIYHQVEVMELLTGLNREGLTIVMALHDLNHAARYCRRLIALKDGRVYCDGAPETVLTPDLLRAVFGVQAAVFPDPVTGHLVCVPYGHGHGRP